MVTTEPRHGGMYNPTSIPPHVALASEMTNIRIQVISLAQVQKYQTETLVATLKSEIDKRVWDSGNITGSGLCEIMALYQSESSSLVDNRILLVDHQLKLIQQSFFELASGTANGDEQPRLMITRERNEKIFECKYLPV